MALKDKIRKKMDELHIKNKELSALSGVPLRTVNNILSGVTGNPTIENVIAIAHALDCTVDDFVDESETNTQRYYLDPEAAKVAKELYERPELKILFDASRDVSKEDLLDVAKLVEKFRRDQEGPDEEDISQDPDDYK